MAIDRTGISSLDAGASDITYSGNEGPRSPQEEQQMMLAQLEQEYEQYRMEQMEIDPSKVLSFEDWYQATYEASRMGVADGGIARLGYDMGGKADIGFSKVQPSKDGSRPGYFTAQRKQEAKEKGQEFGGYSDRERGLRQAQRTAALQESAVPRGIETISPGTGVITKPDGTVGEGYVHRPTGITYDKAYIDKYINVDDEDEEEKEKLARKKEKYEASQRRKRDRIAKEQRKQTIELLNRRKKWDKDFTLPEGWDEDASLDELYGWARTQDWTGKEKYSDLEGREINPFWEKEGFVPGSKDAPGWLSAIYPEKPVTFDEIEQAFQKGKGSLFHKGAGDYRVWSPDFGSKESASIQEKKAFHPNQYAAENNLIYNPITRTFTPRGEGGPEPEVSDPCKGPNPPAYCAARDDDDDDNGGDDDEDDGYIRFESDIAPEHLANIQQMHGGVLPSYYGADGGRAGYAGGGNIRQRYFLGGLGKLFKGITKPFKKILKSPVGKLAIMAALGYGTGMFGSGAGGNFLTKMIGKKGLPGVMSTTPWSGAVKSMGPGTTGSTGLLGKAFLKKGATDWSLANISPLKSILLSMGAGSLMGGDDDELKGYDYGKLNELKAYYDDLFKDSDKRIRFEADGGRIGYAGGKDHRAAALSAMYGLRKKAQEGGLMDLGGMEKDYRQEGGFVPIGGEERADDVPARLSKNEFVFTADAVRAAGGGDIDAGAEVMENVMENLEQGGQVSEESQGLEGARNMFATAQRLEGVM